MQQDNNYMENKLRQLENQQLPDMSRLEENWQQMQGMLQATPAPANTGKNGKTKWIILSAIILIGLTVTYFAFNGKNDASKISSQQSTNSNAANTITAATTPIDANTTTTSPAVISSTDNNASTAVQKSITVSKDNHQKKNSSKKDYTPVFPPINPHDSFRGSSYIPVHTPDSAAKETKPDILKNILAQAAKQAQTFMINNKVDTMLRCAEGTVLIVPANCFGGLKDVKLSVTEFYKFSDIILQQLTTESNKNQLITGGMFKINASVNDKEIGLDKKYSIGLFMPDTGKNMIGMQLFMPNSNESSLQGQQDTMADGSGRFNWIQQSQSFLRISFVTQVKVLNTINMPYWVKHKRKGEIGYFAMGRNMSLKKDELKAILKKKYGYFKVRLRDNNWESRYMINHYNNSITYFTSDYGSTLGDSIWIDKVTADSFKLPITATRQIERYTSGAWSVCDSNNASYRLMQRGDSVTKAINNKYSVNLSKLGWINCDRFMGDSREKFQYAINLGDEAQNYYTVLVFDKIKSIMTGYTNGNKVMFSNIPAGEPVTLVSIGINKEGKTVYCYQQVVTSKTELAGLHFETIDPASLKTALGKIDK